MPKNAQNEYYEKVITIRINLGGYSKNIDILKNIKINYLT